MFFVSHPTNFIGITQLNNELRGNLKVISVYKL